MGYLEDLITMLAQLMLASVVAQTLASTQCGTWCEDNGHSPDNCDCGVCGSSGGCTLTCRAGGSRVACPAPPPPPGKYDTAYEDVTVGGYVCGYSQDARVYYPITDEKVPVISFTHGYGAKGEKGTTDYGEHHLVVAAAGYVLIHLKSGSEDRGECSDIWKDQMRSLEFLKTSPLGERVDWSVPTGVMGHSMGGGATYHSAAQASYIDKHNIGAAVCYNPQIQKMDLFPITDSLVPIMFTTGTSDIIIKSSDVRDAYMQTSAVSKVFANLEGGRHSEPVTPNRLVGYSIAMMDCHLRKDEVQCYNVYGDESTSLCGGNLTMQECLHENEPVDGMPSLQTSV